ncbi:MAG: glycosyltransferase family 61 protein [Bosea sp.]|jgi:hypothetical protein|nr:glycosyltransferase family 61 protein [Bosea sp. (in: a-proteobacteria)]
MARRKSRLQRMLDLKPLAYRGLSALTDAVPAAHQFLSFYPEIGPVPDRRIATILDERKRHALAQPAFAPQLAALAQHDWDVHRDNIIDRDPWSALRQMVLVGDVLVPGHRLAPVDPETNMQIGAGRRGALNWFYSRPQGFPRRRLAVAGPAFVLNPYWNIWHLLVEVLIPLAAAARLRAWGDAELQVLTYASRPALVDALVEGLQKQLKVRMKIVPLGFNDVAEVRSCLIADNVCWNVERAFSFPEAMRDMAAAFAAAYGPLPSPFDGKARRLYITRKGAKLRQIINEQEVLDLMRARGFAVLQANWNNHPAQLGAFMNAENVVGVHGAGLTHLLMAPPGTKVIEMFPFDHRKTSMLHLCAEMGHRHRSFLGGPERLNQAFMVDVGKLAEAIED